MVPGAPHPWCPYWWPLYWTPLKTTFGPCCLYSYLFYGTCSSSSLMSVLVAARIQPALQSQSYSLESFSGVRPLTHRNRRPTSGGPAITHPRSGRGRPSQLGIEEEDHRPPTPHSSPPIRPPAPSTIKAELRLTGLESAEQFLSRQWEGVRRPASSPPSSLRSRR